MARMKELALLVESPQILAAALDCPWPMIHVDQKLLELPEIAQIRQCGKRLGVWTVNSEAEIFRAVHSGAAMIITDQPLLARKPCSDRSA
jgi:glycerophosphoryl diester phosphodiesterase